MAGDSRCKREPAEQDQSYSRTPLRSNTRRKSTQFIAVAELTARGRQGVAEKPTALVGRVARKIAQGRRRKPGIAASGGSGLAITEQRSSRATSKGTSISEDSPWGANAAERRPSRAEAQMRSGWGELRAEVAIVIGFRLAAAFEGAWTPGPRLEP